MTKNQQNTAQGTGQTTGGQIAVQTGDPEQFGAGVQESVDNGGSGQEPPPPPPPPAAQEENGSGRVFTAEEVEAIRRQEKDKLYGRIESLDETVKRLREEQEAREKAEQEAREAAEQEAEAERRRLEAEELSAKELLEKRDREWQDRFESMQQEIARRDAALEKEREFAALQEYRTRRMREEQENILPELLDLITGNNPDEVEQSVAALRHRTASILQNVSQTAGDMRSQMQGASITAPPVGPSDTQQDHKSFSAEDIAAMSMQDYSKYRARLLDSANRQVTERGLYD